MPTVFFKVVRVGLGENMAWGQRCEWVLGWGGWQPWGIAFQVERASGAERGPHLGQWRSSQEAGEGREWLSERRVPVQHWEALAGSQRRTWLAFRWTFWSCGASRRRGTQDGGIHTGSRDSAFCCLWC